MNHAGGDFIGHHYCSQRAVQYSELAAFCDWTFSRFYHKRSTADPPSHLIPNQPRSSNAWLYTWQEILTQNQIWKVKWVYKRSGTHLIGLEIAQKNWHKNLLLIVAKLALRISWLNLMSCPKRTISKCVPTITLKVSETSLSLFAWDGFGKRGALRRPDAVHREM